MTNMCWGNEGHVVRKWQIPGWRICVRGIRSGKKLKVCGKEMIDAWLVNKMAKNWWTRSKKRCKEWLDACGSVKDLFSVSCESYANQGILVLWDVFV